MTTIEQMESTEAAVRLLTRVRVALSDGPLSVWRKVDRAVKHLDDSMAALMDDE